MPNKKENKTSEVEKPVPASPAQPPKKKNGCLVAAIIAIALFLLIGAFILIWLWPFIFSFLLDLRSGDFSLPKMSESASGTLKGKNLAGLVDPSKTVTQRIIAKNGGQITARTANGLYFTLNIAPGSLEKDMDISITPINESPIENYPNPSDPGVVIGPPGTNLGNGSTVTVSGNPPTSGGSGAQPGTGADGGTTSTPPTTPPTAPPGTPPGTLGTLPDLGSLANLFGGSTPSSAPPAGRTGTTGSAGGNNGQNNADSQTNPPGNNPRFTGTSVIIFVSYGGGVSTVPTEPSDDGDSISGPVDQTGGTSTDDPDNNESGSLANNAAANSGGTCSPEFLQTMANAAQAGGAGSQAAQAALRDCFNVEWLNNLCVNDPVKLRRMYFQQRLILARRYDAQAASEIESLMNQCQAKYHFHAEGVSPEASGGDVTVFSSLDSTVCGYVDDEWTGAQTYQLSAGPGSGHSFQGTADFKLPPGGGQFSGISHGANSFTVGGQSVAIPNFDFGFWGYFDGGKTINNLDLYPDVVISSTPIELQEKPCVPLAPLPR